MAYCITAGLVSFVILQYPGISPPSQHQSNVRRHAGAKLVAMAAQLLDFEAARSTHDVRCAVRKSKFM